MLFNSFTFWGFFALVALLTFSVPARHSRAKTNPLELGWACRGGGGG